MPVIAKCKGCGYILYDGKFQEMRYLSQTPTRSIFDKYNGKCPKCGRKLKMPSSKDIRMLPNPEYFPRKKKKMNLDMAIIDLLKEHEGRVSRSKMWQDFDNYSRGYLYERILALKRSGWIIEEGGWYILTKKGQEVKT